MSRLELLFSKRFGPIFVCMALGAFNDNFYKNAVIILITYVFADSLGKDAALLISFAAASFILPFFLFSGIAGLIADRYAKHVLVRAFKITELALCVLAGVALMVHHMSSLMVILFLFGMQAAFFGPVKYAILPELVKKTELLGANGMVEAGTFLCILIGTLTGGLLILHPLGVHLVAWIMIFLGLVGVYTASKVPVTKAALPQLKISYSVLSTTKLMLQEAVRNPRLWFAILGISWFWAIGATYLTQIPVFAKEVVGGDETISSLYMALFSIGIGTGALSCQSLLKNKRNAHTAPMALTGICLFGLHLVWVAAGMTAPEELFRLNAYFTSPDRWWLALDLFGLATCGGIFIVPLYTQLQVKSKESERARAIASNNVMNALFSSIAAVLAAAFYGLGLHVNDVLLIIAGANIPVIYYLYRHVAWAK